jgi:hypothetical protein
MGLKILHENIKIRACILALGCYSCRWLANYLLVYYPMKIPRKVFQIVIWNIFSVDFTIFWVYEE